MTFDEPTYIEKLAYMRAADDISATMNFLAQFEGTPLAPQAIALAEQELAQDQRRLQKQMVRDAQRQTDDMSSDWNESEGIRLQKQQLQLELYKMKAMTPAPQPGDAEIGTPDPAVQAVQAQQAAEAEAQAAQPTAAPAEAAPAPEKVAHAASVLVHQRKIAAAASALRKKSTEGGETIGSLIARLAGGSKV